LLLPPYLAFAGNGESVLGAFQRNEAVAEAVLEAAVRMAASCTAEQQSLLPMVQQSVFAFMQHVQLSRAASGGRAGQPAAGPLAAGSWQPTLLLTCLKAAAKRLYNSTASALAVLRDATCVAAHATCRGPESAAAWSGHATNMSTAVAADPEPANLLLLAGRALHVAACALLQLHESAATPAAAAAAPAAHPQL
jgi:hypothetical protein